MPSRFMGLVWFLYSLLGVLWIAVGLHQFFANRHEEGIIVFTIAFQVIVGLLLVSVHAASSLAEERARGSLDVLLSTPLSTLSIVVGKWWGSFHLVLHVIFWPILLSIFLIIDGGNWISYLLLVGLVLAYGAGIASLGLALATWVNRLGRAIALCVSICMGCSLGWIFLVMLICRRDQVGLTLVMASPLYGTPLATVAIVPRERGFASGDDFSVAAGTVLWTLVYSAIAAVLFKAVLVTFNRCVGRMRETSGSSLDEPQKKVLHHVEPDLYELLADDIAG
jgi:ABC-type Na+ efflux pump permease subunit